MLRIFFYKVAVKVYGSYLSLIRKLGWSNSKFNSVFSFLFDQKLVHGLVVLFTIVMVFFNLTADTKAQSQSEASGKTILSTLISSEFDSPDSGQVIVETFDQESTISPTQQNYLDNLSSERTQPVAQMNPDANQDIFTDEQGNDGSLVATPGVIGTNRTKQDRHEVINYAVQPGDTISTIAQQFEVGVNTILWANNLSAYSVIKPGDSLKILPVSGVLHNVASGESLKSIAAKYNVAENQIASANSIGESDHLKIGQQLIVPGGKQESYAEVKQKTYSGIALLKDLISPTRSTNDSSNQDNSDDAAPDNSTPIVVSPSSGNKMHWPTTGYRITQYFSWRHFAIDVADHVGTPIFAADSGVIQTAGWGNGYGNQILINHGGGKQTRYAHLSKFLVGVGDVVTKGQEIGLMGSTGWSTGPHVHFEVIINGVKYNPLNYVR